MDRTIILFDEPPPKETNRYSNIGPSPKIFNYLKSYLQEHQNEIESINLALYLFNNFELHSIFQKLALKGIKINVISIPLEGYDNSYPQTIYYDSGEWAFKKRQTKKSLAQIVYQGFINTPIEGYNLYIFPHAYIRSSKIKPFSRGKIPYSLHIKSLLISFKNGTVVNGLLSSNMAVRDLPKYDNMLLQELTGQQKKPVQLFFNHLINSSVHIRNYIQQINSINYPFHLEESNQCMNNYFVSPFYKNSPMVAEKIISELISSAQKRIWVMAQHLSAFNYSYPLNYRIKKKINVKKRVKGILYNLMEKANDGVQVKCLTQTYACDSEPTQKFRCPTNTYHFKQFITAYKKLPNASYGVNKNIHSKYIIVDDKVVVTTFNYTPSQFIYLPYVKIETFDYIPDLKYEGIFSEVGQLIKLESKKETNYYIENFESVWKNDQTVITIQ